jgi:hypothetical protein
MVNDMKKLFVALLMIACASQAFASGGSEGTGGGDLCEDRIKAVRDDIRDWIAKGGPRGLELPVGVSVEQYSHAMLEQIQSASIKCVGPGDKGYPVEVLGTPKICRFDRTSTKSSITCDIQKFQAQADSDQYVLVHHEYAGLAGLERPSRDDSNYDISNQISGYLVEQIVKKLAVRSAPANHPVSPVVEQFRTLFRNARTPSLVELNVGKLWTCTSAPTHLNEVDQISPLRFQAAGPIITNGVKGVYFQSFVFEKGVGLVSGGPITHWISGKVAGRFLATFRVDADGNLIGEFSMDNPEARAYPARDSFLRSIIDKTIVAIGYLYCDRKNVE